MEKEDIAFIEYCMPGLKSGTYDVTISEHVVIDNDIADETYSIVRHFQVRGERFRVPSNEIHSVFPPEKSTGPYIGRLPYVLFNRAMLPWLRGLGEAAQQTATWLAVLLFDSDEMPSISRRAVRDLIGLGIPIHVPGGTSDVGTLLPDHLSYPFAPPWGAVCELEYGESADNNITTIDIPTGLFQSIAPSASDLSWLAHVREVDLEAGRMATAPRGGKATDAAPDLGQFSTVLGNRLPAIGDSHAVLVSLEGLGDYLPGGTKDICQYKYVRLVVLKDWSFSIPPTDNNDTILLHALEHLCDDPGGTGKISHLRIPIDIPDSSDVADALTAEQSGAMSSAQADVLARHAFAMGYVPLLHKMRTGGQNISWYRSPLVPLPVKAPLSMPLDSTDSGLAYNPETGMFDVSYAAAWQLGQILALSDKQFSTALYAWWRGVVEQEAANSDQLGASVAYLQAIASTKNQDLEVSKQTASLLANILSARFLGAHGRGVGRASEEGPPATILTWLDGLKHFNRIPLRYLIPDSRMLGSESLRFFYLDINWINAMLDGACSIVRSISGKPISPTPWLYAPSSAGKITGCLINSQIVISWPGLRISAYNGQTLLSSIHDDQLTTGLRLLLFEGELNRLEIQESGEELHFGVDFDGQNYSVNLRYLQDQVGKLITGDTVSALMRDTGKRVIDISSTSNNIKNGLLAQNQLDGEGHFTSAEYALETVTGTAHVSYQLDQTQG